MRRLALAALAAFATTQSAHAQGGTACRLSNAECATIDQEDARAKAYARQVYWSSSHLPAYPRGLAAIDAEAAYVRERIRRIPARIGNEWVRMIVCRTQADTLRITGKVERHKSCR